MGIRTVRLSWTGDLRSGTRRLRGRGVRLENPTTRPTSPSRRDRSPRPQIAGHHADESHRETNCRRGHRRFSSLWAARPPTRDPLAAEHAPRSITSCKDSFGTPAASRDRDRRDRRKSMNRRNVSALTPDSLTEGGKLFRQHCLQCHNLTGDGRGPAGNSVYAVSLATSAAACSSSSRPARTASRAAADTLRTLAEGLEGTAMPSFGLLSGAERDLLAGYVTYLSIRGQVEFETLAAVLSGETYRRSRLRIGPRESRSGGMGRRPRPPPRSRRARRRRTGLADRTRRPCSADTSCSPAKPTTRASPATPSSAASRCCGTTCGGPWRSPRT